MKRLLALGLLFTLLHVGAHGAPDPKDQDIRLLHDCNDDYFGSELVNREGYDLHSLDLREMYDGTGNVLVFRLVLNGDGPADIDVSFKVGGATKSYSFTKASSWSGTFDSVSLPADVNDGTRFSLEGTVSLAKLGASVGSKLSDYNAIGTYPDGSDSLRSFDGPTGTFCDDSTVFFPDANQDGTPDAYSLRGPVQFFATSLGAPSTTLKVGEQKLVEVSIQNKISSAQNVELRATNGENVVVQFHNLGSEAYEDEGRIGLGPKGTAGNKVLHVVVEGAKVGSGTIDVTITSNLGGRVIKTLNYEVTNTPTASSSASSSSSESKASPAPLGIALVGLALLARRR